MGGDRLPPPDPHVPPARRPVPAVPLAAGPAERDPRQRAIRSWSSRTASPRWRPAVDQDVRRRARGPAGGAAPGFRPVRGRLLHRRARAGVRRAGARAGAPGRRRLGGADGGAGRASTGVEQVFAFENHGEEIGVTLAHPHGQIYAYPFLTPRVEKILAVGAAGTGRRPAATCSPSSWRPSGPGPRVVTQNEHWTAFVPAAARWPYEVQFFPTRKRARPAGAGRRRAGRLRRGLPRRAGPLRPPLRHPDALHRLLEPGAGARRAGGLVAAPAAVLVPAGAREAEVPRRVRVGDGRVHHRHQSRRTSPSSCVPWWWRERRSDGGRAGTGRRSPSGSAASPRASGPRPGGSTSSASTPTTTTASCCRWRCRTPRGRRSARRTDGRVAFASLQGDGAIVELDLAELAPGRPDGWAGYPAGRRRRPARAAGRRRERARGHRRPGRRRAVVVGGADLLGGPGAARPGRPRARPDRPRRAGPAVGERLRRAPRPASSTSRPRCCAPPATRCSWTPATQRTEQVPLDLAAAGLELLVVDTGTSHTPRRRRLRRPAPGVRAGRRAARRAGRCATCPTSPAWRRWTRGDVLLRRARHIVTENARVLEVVAHPAGHADPRAIGPVLTAGHASLRDDFQISTDELDACVDAAVAAGAHGARMVGGGFGGSAVVLVDRDRAGAVAEAVAGTVRARGLVRAAHLRRGAVRRGPTDRLEVVSPEHGDRHPLDDVVGHALPVPRLVDRLGAAARRWPGRAARCVPGVGVPV